MSTDRHTTERVSSRVDSGPINDHASQDCSVLVNDRFSGVPQFQIFLQPIRLGWRQSGVRYIGEDHTFNNGSLRVSGRGDYNFSLPDTHIHFAGIVPDISKEILLVTMSVLVHTTMVFYYAPVDGMYGEEGVMLSDWVGELH